MKLKSIAGPLAALLLVPSAHAVTFTITDIGRVSGDVGVCPNTQIVALTTGERGRVRVWGHWLENTGTIADNQNGIVATLVPNSARNGLSHNDQGFNRKGKGLIDVDVSARADISSRQATVTMTDRNGKDRDTFVIRALRPARITTMDVPNAATLGDSFTQFDVTVNGSDFSGLAAANQTPASLRAIGTTIASVSDPIINADGTRIDRGGMRINGQVVELTNTRLVARFQAPQSVPLNRLQFSMEITDNPCAAGASGFAAASPLRRNVRVVGTALPDEAYVSRAIITSPSGRNATPGDDVSLTFQLTRTITAADAPSRSRDPRIRFDRTATRNATEVAGNLVLWQLSGNVFSALPGTAYSPQGTQNGYNVAAVAVGQDRVTVRFHLDRCPPGAQDGQTFNVQLRMVMHDAIATAQPDFKTQNLSFTCVQPN